VISADYVKSPGGDLVQPRVNQRIPCTTTIRRLVTHSRSPTRPALSASRDLFELREVMQQMAGHLVYQPIDGQRAVLGM
jgi:hypothetical protein